MKLKNRVIASLVVIAPLLFLNACGSDTPASTPNTIASLPQATGPVTTSHSVVKAIENAVNLPSRGMNLFSATTGKKLVDWSSITWSSSTSGPFCDAGNMVSGIFRDASNPDKILCYIGALDAGGLVTNPYDGNYHYMTVDNTPGRSGSIKVKMKIVRGANGISTFEMFDCQGGTTQSEYTKMDLSNGATVTAVHANNSGGQVSSNRATVTGTVDTSGKWVSKTITSYNYYSAASRTASSSGNYNQVRQFSDQVSVTGTAIGDYGGNTSSSQLFAMLGILNTDSYATFALGNGIAKQKSTYSGCASCSLDSSLRAWNGDTAAKVTADSTVDNYATVTGTALADVIPKATVQTTTAFTTAETWDCTPPTGTTFTSVDFTGGGTATQTAIAACNTKFGEGGGSWVQCWNSGADYTQ